MQAVKRYQGKGVIWEIYNEPNIKVFWHPTPSPYNYSLLVQAVATAFRQEAPSEVLIAPATSEIDFKFLEEVFKFGILQYIDAVSIHPYRQEEPESVRPDFEHLRSLIVQYAPTGKHLPIVVSEWGYSAGL